MRPFKVLTNFQHGGIDYEEGNTHRKHTVSDEDVGLLIKWRWVSEIVPGSEPSTLIQPADITINLEAHNG